MGFRRIDKSAEGYKATLHVGQADTPDIGLDGMQALFDAHPNLNTDALNALMGELEDPQAAGKLGAAPFKSVCGLTVQEQIENVYDSSVHLIGDDVIAGGKTFTDSISVPKATKEEHAVQKGQVYIREEIEAAVNMDKGALASINGVSNAGGDVSLVGRTGVRIEEDEFAKEIRLYVTGETEPAPHAYTHAPGSIDALQPHAYTHIPGGIDELQPHAHTHALGETDPINLNDIGAAQNTLANVSTLDFSAKMTESGVNPTTYSPFMRGMILLWSGSVASVPGGWALCNGANGTPDLRGRFLLGAGGAYAVNANGGAESVALTEAQMPSHNHAASLTESGSGHRHTAPSSSLVMLSNGSNPVSKLNGTDNSGYTVVTVSGSTAYTGSGQAHSNMPPYYALAYIMKL